MTRTAKLGVLGSLYFSQGLPYGFFTQALPVVLRKQGYTLTEIGLTSLLAIPWALKFLWAPAVDRFWSPAIGRRRSWILPLQLVSVLTLVGLAFLPVQRSMTLVMAAVMLLNLLSATQDIATDGLAVEIIAPAERGLVNGLQVAGYRMGMIIGGGALLIFHERLGTHGTFLAMAGLIALASVPIVRAKEPARVNGTESLGAPAVSVAVPSIHFLRRPGTLPVLVLILSYKFGDAFAVGMLRPFLADAGLSLGDVGWLLGTVGFVAGLLGALCGGAWVNRLGRRNALLVFGVLQAATVAGYAYLAFAHPTREWLTVLCGAEHFAGGMATAALFTCMMDWCGAESSATDYTVQASAVVIATGVASTLSGMSAQALGYFGHFSFATVLALVSLIAVARCFPARTVAAAAAP
jgi:PAT family beta-lactamase induction signal transducer AmpG